MNLIENFYIQILNVFSDGVFGISLFDLTIYHCINNFCFISLEV